MTTIAQSADSQSAEIGLHPAGRQRILRGLYWHEWFSHGSQMLVALSIWLVGQWILEVFLQPMWVIVWGTALGLWLGFSFGGSDTTEGVEEFSLALPPRRTQRYIIRLTMSLTFLLVLVGCSLLAIAFNWPQKLWGLLVETGFTASYRHSDETVLLSGMALFWSLCTYGVSFGFAAMATSRDQVALGALFGIGYTIAAWLISAAVHPVLGTDASMYVFSWGLTLFLAGLLLTMGYWGYKRKDGITRPRGMASPEWRTAMIVTGGLLLLMVLTIAAVGYMQWLRAS